MCGIARGQPAVRPRFKKLTIQEERVPSDIFTRVLEGMEIKNLDTLGPTDLREPYLLVDCVDDDAQLIDCQEEHMYRSWHFPGVRHLSPKDLMSSPIPLERGKKYILYCTYGTQTPLLAERLQLAGLEAYAFRGGVRRLQRVINAQESQ